MGKEEKKARELYDKALAIRTSLQGPRCVEVGIMLSNQAARLEAAKKYDEAKVRKHGHIRGNNLVYYMYILVV